MNIPVKALFSILVATGIGKSEPVGICLHTYSPEAPDAKIDCFEFERSEKIQTGIRFFLPNGTTTIVTTYRLRGIVNYPTGSSLTQESLPKVLAGLETRARQSPTTRVFLNPWIQKLRNSQVAAAVQREELSKLPDITLADGTQLKQCRATKRDDISVTILHSDGIKKVPVAELTETTKRSLQLDKLVISTPEGSEKPAVATGSNNSVKTKAASTVAEHAAAEAQFQMGMSYSDGWNMAKDDAKAVECFRKAAELGHVKAQVFLGVCYSNGKGVPVDTKEAAEWYQKAADQGDVYAQVNLGIFLMDGVGVGKDPDRAFRLFLAAAEGGDSRGQYFAGFCYDQGKGTPKNDLEAWRWMLKSASQGNIDAQYIAGKRHANGVGTPKDPTMAFMWFGLASAAGHEEAGKFKNAVREVLSDEQATLCEIIIKNWKPSTDGGGIDFIGAEPFKPLSTQASPKIKSLRTAAEAGDSDAQFDLAFAYDLGEEIPRDFREGVKWYLKAAEQGDVTALFNLASDYVSGGGVPKDKIMAKMWLTLIPKPWDMPTDTLNVAVSRELSSKQIAKAEQMAKAWRASLGKSGVNPQNANPDPSGEGTAGITKPSDRRNHETNSEPSANAEFAEEAGKMVQELEQRFGRQEYRFPDSAGELVQLEVLADRGDPDSQLKLAKCFLEGHGVDKDSDRAVCWLRRAANQGNTIAQWHLGLLIMDGENDIESLMWFELSAGSGNKAGAACRGTFSKQLTPSQIAEAKQRAQSWKPKRE